MQGSILDIEDEQSQGGVCVLGTLDGPGLASFPPRHGALFNYFFPPVTLNQEIQEQN